MKKNTQLLLLIVLCSISFRTQATHIVGGDIAVEWLNGNDFRITLNFFRDCSAGTADFDQTIELGIYDKVTNLMDTTFTMDLFSRTILQLGDTCFTPQNLCVEHGVYKTTLTIHNNPHGYYIAWQRCCRNGIIQNIQNPGGAGMVFYIEIPDPALHDSSPVFGSYPKAYMCAAQTNIQSFSCTDADSDSLVYSLITPLNGFSDQTTVGQYPVNPVLTPGSYPPVSWQTPYSAVNMMGGIPPMTIAPQTGLITAQPPFQGVFVFAVRVEEFRNGVKLGEIRRDIQYQVLLCNLNQPPVFTSPVTTTLSVQTADTAFSIVAGDSLVFTLNLTNNNPADSVFLYGQSELFSSTTGGISASFSNDSAAGTVQQLFYLRTTCDAIRELPYRVTFYGVKYSCYGVDTAVIHADIYVKSPFDGSLDTIIPNVFTPNDDGLNDFFHIRAKPNYCLDKFSMKIYNRWGSLLYETGDFMFQWDGKNKSGNKLSEGVYYYILDATFKENAFHKRGVIHLLM